MWKYQWIVLLCLVGCVMLDRNVFGGVPLFDDSLWDSDFHAPPAPTIDDYDYDTSYDDSDDVRQSNKNASVVPTEVSLSPGSLRFFRQLPNVTKEVGDSIRLRCEAVGDPPPTRYKWFVNEAPLIEQKNRVIIRKVKSNGILTSRLRILKLDVQDSGYYRCEAFNGQQKAETTGIIKAIMSKHGSQDPVPAIPNFQPPFPSVGGTGANLPGLPANFVPKDFPDEFHPSHEFHPDLSDDNDGRGAESHLPRAGRIPTDTLEGTCQLYKGTMCGQILANKNVFVPNGQTQKHIEEKLSSAFTVITRSGDISQSCAEFTVPALCYAAFPLCDDSSSRPMPRRLCRDDCEILEHDLCRLEYAVAKRHPLIDKVGLPECSELPPVGTKDSYNCFSIGIPKQSEVIEEQSCYTGNGHDYRGMASVTISGSICQSWADQTSLRISDFPELLGGHNYCRNPGESESQPWCYTGTRKEACGIQSCPADGTWLYIAVPCVGLLVLILLVISIVFGRQRNKSKLIASNQKTAVITQKNVAGSLNNQQLEMSSLLPRSNQPTPSVASSQQRYTVPEIPLSSIRFLQELGEGAFGKVFKGELLCHDGLGSRPGIPDCLVNGNMSTQIAIKTLKAGATLKTQQDFRREVEMMAELRHPNIVCLLGVVTTDTPQCMLFEYMAQGDLHEFLISHSPRSDVSVSASSDDGTYSSLEQSDFLFIATQIAAGMDYLSSHHYVHRDLAARNCLVGERLTVKISDFGLSRDIYATDYYRVQSKSLLPVRWMPAEAIMYGKFTTESDVYSFGVVLWEIYSYGLQPYYGYSNQEVVEMVRSRQLLPCPEECPSRVYALMVECWCEVPLRRPTFQEIHTRLRSWEGLASSGQTVSSGIASFPNRPPSHSSVSQHSSTGPSNNTGSTQLSGAGQYAQPRQGVMSPVPSVSSSGSGQTYPQCYAQTLLNFGQPLRPNQHQAVLKSNGQVTPVFRVQQNLPIAHHDLGKISNL
ncbi:tyrosine-protein kinase transmembrane receptor Ror-like isoform X2 [Artemia franciscana]|uniref:tyrosine-protein kinase transmembrane receptor Ror-like isoform X2 n=1 Tax=Artemia franciscana TaxID=6661 RepID=UPI0032DB0040